MTDQDKIHDVEDKLDGNYPDYGIHYPRGKPLVRIRSGKPKAGQYLFDPKTGWYSFSKGDANRTITFNPKSVYALPKEIRYNLDGYGSLRLSSLSKRLSKSIKI
jgi:hypothetical protein